MTHQLRKRSLQIFAEKMVPKLVGVVTHQLGSSNTASVPVKKIETLKTNPRCFFVWGHDPPVEEKIVTNFRRKNGSQTRGGRDPPTRKLKHCARSSKKKPKLTKIYVFFCFWVITHQLGKRSLMISQKKMAPELVGVVTHQPGGSNTASVPVKKLKC